MGNQLATTVMLVDDEKEFIEILSQRLETRGFTVKAVTGGQEALTVLEKQDIDVAIVDFAMPGINGIETLKQIKETRPDIEVIMLTAQGTIQSGIEAMKNGAMDYLEKPVDVNILMEKIRSAKKQRMTALEKKAADQVKNIQKSKSW